MTAYTLYACIVLVVIFYVHQCGRHFDALRDFTAALTFCLAANAPHSSGATTSSKLIGSSSSTAAGAVATTAALGPLYFNRAVVRTR